MTTQATTKTPFFSVVITTYNRLLLLQRALKSLWDQTEQDWEAIIIDDGSTDPTEEFIRGIQPEHPRLHYYKQNSCGAVAAKNAGILAATGQYITFLDSDDEFHPRHLQLRKDMLLAAPETELLHGGIKIIGSNFVPDRFHYGQAIHLKDCAVGATFVIKKTLIQRLNLFREIPLGSDADFLERAQANQAQIRQTNLPSYIYHREHNNTITRNLMGSTAMAL